jgi:hypothetical protein
MSSENEELDYETLKQLLLTTREKLFSAVMANIELETALKIERDNVKFLKENKTDK